MCVWFNTKPDILISNWRSLRQELTESSLSDLEILKNVETYFSGVPRGPRSIDYYTPKNWPLPWEIIHHKLFCNSSVTLLQYYTLMLIPQFDKSKIELYLLEDTQDEYVVLVYDGKYLLNYQFGEVLDFSEHRKRFKINERVLKNEIPQIS